jgi:hypothetical protein
MPGGHRSCSPDMGGGCDLRQQQSGAPRPAARRTSCHVHGGYRMGHHVSALAAGIQWSVGHCAWAAGRRHEPGADVSLATLAGHLPSGRRSFRKQRTVNPPLVPARYNVLYSSSGSALRAAACGGRPRAGSDSTVAGRPASPPRRVRRHRAVGRRIVLSGCQIPRPRSSPHMGPLASRWSLSGHGSPPLTSRSLQKIPWRFTRVGSSRAFMGLDASCQSRDDCSLRVETARSSHLPDRPCIMTIQLNLRGGR